MNLVLVHGILGFRQKFGVEYFRGVAEHFRAQAFAALVPELDPTRGIEFRSNQLRDQINNSFNNGLLNRNEKTHIVAHSMGGLDSRCLLSPVSGMRLAAPVRSLTTISTPHQGSPIADLIDKPVDMVPFPHLPFGPAGNPLELALNELGISLDGLRDLTTVSSQAFSAKYINDPSVAYFSVGGTGRLGPIPTASTLLEYRKAQRRTCHGGFRELGDVRSGNLACRPRRRGGIQLGQSCPASLSRELRSDRRKRGDALIEAAS